MVIVVRILGLLIAVPFTIAAIVYDVLIFVAIYRVLTGPTSPGYILGMFVGAVICSIIAGIGVKLMRVGKPGAA